jgi:hypothetical protein
MKNYTNPYIGNEKIENFLESIDWEKVNDLSLYQINNKIRKIIEIKDRSWRKYQGYFDSVIHNLKDIGDKKPNSRARVSRRDHVMRDHAFCRVLELIEGLDILHLKDKAVDALENSEEYEPIYSNDGFIVSIKEIDA